MSEYNTWDNGFLRAISHPTNRKIIEWLQCENLTFTELLSKVADHDHGKFGYHLRTLSQFVRLDRVSRKYRLTDRGKLLAAAIESFRFLSSKGQEASSYVEHLEIGDHAIAFYDEDDTHRKVFSFFKTGLSRGCAVVYVLSEDKLISEIREMQKHGLDLHKIPKGALVVMPAEEWYLEKGKAKGKTIVANWMRLIQEKKKAGFAGVYAAGEMITFINNAKSEQLLRYEESLGRQLVFDLCAMCIYDKSILKVENVTRLLACHGHIISGEMIGRVPQEPPFSWI